MESLCYYPSAHNWHNLKSFSLLKIICRGKEDTDGYDVIFRSGHL